MADSIWPLNLPQAPRLADLDEQPPDLALRTQMDVGPDKVRRRTTAGVRRFSIGLALTATQVALLDDWFFGTLMAGTLTFEWKHPRTGVTADFRFVGAPRYAPRQPRSPGGQERWTASFTIELLPSGDDDGLGGGDPGVCLKMFGATGATIWGTDSTLTVAITAACRSPGGAIYNETTNTITMSFVEATYDGSGQIQSVHYRGGVSNNSHVYFDRDLGWSYSINAADWPDPGCGSDATLGPTALSEDGVFVLNKGMNQADNAWAVKFCGSTTLDWFESLEVTHNPGSCPINPDRAKGFWAYTAVCGAIV